MPAANASVTVTAYAHNHHSRRSISPTRAVARWDEIQLSIVRLCVKFSVTMNGFCGVSFSFSLFFFSRYELWGENRGTVVRLLFAEELCRRIILVLVHAAVGDIQYLIQRLAILPFRHADAKT